MDSSFLVFATQTAGVPPDPIWKMVLGVLMLILVIVGAAWYAFRLRMDFYKGCRENKNLALFAQSPLGLPEGSVRSSLALIIVIFSIGYIVINGGTNEALTAVLGSVLGFYFGNRTASKAGGLGNVVEAQMNELKTEKESAVVNKVNGLMKDVEKGIAMSKVVMAVLPKDTRKKCEGLIDKLDSGHKMVKGLLGSGKVSDAASTAEALFSAFKSDNPAKDIVTKALSSFGKVLGSTTPSLAVVGAVVGIGAKLSGAIYDIWKARILHAPFSPAVLQSAVVDSTSGFVLLARCPTFKKVFMKELEAQDGPFLNEAAQLFLVEEDPEKMWAKYKDRFDSREQFEQGLEEYRRVVVDRGLSPSVDAELAASVGGYDKLVETIDTLHADSSAQADLDALVTVFETLQSNGQSAEAIFKKVKAGVTE